MLLTTYLEAYFVHTVLIVSIYGLTKRERLGRGGRAWPEAKMGGEFREAAGRAEVGGWYANNILLYNYNYKCKCNTVSFELYLQ